MNNIELAPLSWMVHRTNARLLRSTGFNHCHLHDKPASQAMPAFINLVSLFYTQTFPSLGLSALLLIVFTAISLPVVRIRTVRSGTLPRTWSAGSLEATPGQKLRATVNLVLQQQRQRNYHLRLLYCSISVASTGRACGYYLLYLPYSTVLLVLSDKPATWINDGSIMVMA